MKPSVQIDSDAYSPSAGREARRFSFVSSFLCGVVVCGLGLGGLAWIVVTSSERVVSAPLLLFSEPALERAYEKQVRKYDEMKPLPPVEKSAHLASMMQVPRAQIDLPNEGAASSEAVVPVISEFFVLDDDATQWFEKKPQVLEKKEVVAKVTRRKSPQKAVAKLSPKPILPPILKPEPVATVTRPKLPVGPTQAAQVARRVSPSYPRSSRRAGAEGSSLVAVTIAQDGRISSALIARSSGHTLLDKAALAAVRQWRFSPALDKGKPIVSRLNVPITFRLQ